MSNDRSQRPRRILAIIGLPLLLALLMVPAIVFRHDLWRLFTSVKAFTEWIKHSGPAAPLVFIALQVFHVIVFIIPGEVLQIAGGYLFGTWPGTLYAVIGILIGSPIDFYLARLLGVPFVQAIFPPPKVQKTMALLDSRGSKTIFFFLFLVPGMPKDFLCYVAGLTPLRFRFFMAASLLGRLQGIIGSSLMGNSAAENRWALSVSIFGASVVLFLLGFFLRGRIEGWFRRLRAVRVTGALEKEKGGGNDEEGEDGRRDTVSCRARLDFGNDINDIRFLREADESKQSRHGKKRENPRKIARPLSLAGGELTHHGKDRSPSGNQQEDALPILCQQGCTRAGGGGGKNRGDCPPGLGCCRARRGPLPPAAAQHPATARGRSASWEKHWSKDMFYHEPKLWERIDTFRREYVFSVVSKLLEEGMKDGFIRPEIDGKLVPVLFMSAVSTVMTPAQLVKLSVPPSELFDAFIRILFGGILTEKRRSGNSLPRRKNSEKDSRCRPCMCEPGRLPEAQPRHSSVRDDGSNQRTGIQQIQRRGSVKFHRTAAHVPGAVLALRGH